MSAAGILCPPLGSHMADSGRRRPPSLNSTPTSASGEAPSPTAFLESLTKHAPKRRRPRAALLRSPLRELLLQVPLQLPNGRFPPRSPKPARRLVRSLRQRADRGRRPRQRPSGRRSPVHPLPAPQPCGPDRSASPSLTHPRSRPRSRSLEYPDMASMVAVSGERSEEKRARRVASCGFDDGDDEAFPARASAVAADGRR